MKKTDFLKPNFIKLFITTTFLMTLFFPTFSFAGEYPSLVKNFGGTNDEQFEHVQRTDNGEYIAIGYSNSNNNDLEGLHYGTTTYADGIIVKYDSNLNVIWKRIFGGTYYDKFNHVFITGNDEFVAVGSSSSTDLDLTGLNRGERDAIIVKYDTNGEVIWKKTFGGSNDEQFNAVEQSNDGGFIAIGSSGSTNIDLKGYHYGNAYSNDGIIVKYDVNGNVVWKKNFGGALNDYFYGIQKTTDGGFVVVGYSYSYDYDLLNLHHGTRYYGDAIIVKYDANGNVTWKKHFGGTNSDVFSRICTDSDGNYIVVGNSSSTDIDLANLHYGTTYNEDAIIVKYDNWGNLIWKKNFGGTSRDLFQDIQITKDNGYVVTGYAASSDEDLTGYKIKNDYDGILVKYDTHGDVTWKKNIGGTSSDCLYSVQQINNDEFVAVGMTSSTDGDLTGLPNRIKSNADAIIVKFSDDSVRPTISPTIDSTAQTAGSVVVTATAIDDKSGIAITKFAPGTHPVSYFSHLGANLGITFNSTFTVNSNGFYTIYTRDKGDNEQITTINISNISKTNLVSPLSFLLEIGGSGEDRGSRIYPTSDGGYVVIGTSTSSDGDFTGLHYSVNKVNADAFIIKYDKNNNIMWKVGKLDDSFSDIKQTTDGGYIVVGESYSDGIIIKYDANGNVLWNRNFGGPKIDSFITVLLTDDGGYIALGNGQAGGDLTGLNYGSYDLILVKYDADGNVVWKKNYGGTGFEYGGTFEQVDGGYILTFQSTSTDYDLAGLKHSDGIILKVDNNGKTLWKTSFGGTSTDYFKGISPTSDGGFIAVGQADSNDGDLAGLHNGSTYYSDAIIVKYDSNGNIAWKKNFGGTRYDYFKSVQETKDGGFLVVGHANSSDGDLTGFNVSTTDAIVVKYSANGNLVSKYTIAGTGMDWGYGLVRSGDGNYLMICSSDSTNGHFTGRNKGGTDSYFIKYHDTLIDSTPPTIIVIQPIIWGKTNTVTTTITDSGTGVAVQKWSSGVQATSYFKSGGTIFTGSSFVVTANGTFTVYAKDNAGNETVKTVTVNRVDVTTPNGGAKLTPFTFTNDSVTINFIGIDAESGVASITKPDGTVVAGSTASYVVKDNGTYNFTVIDNAGNEKVITIPVSNIDKTAPTTEPSLEGTEGNNGWYTSDVKVTLLATDNAGGSGVAGTEYSFDGTTWNTYTVPFTVNAEGSTTIYYRSSDKAENRENNKTIVIKIDKTPPIITGTATTQPNANGWYNSNVIISFRAFDSISGLGDTIKPDVEISTEGENQSVTETVTDMAGNSASFTVTNINIDKSKPQISINVPTNGSEYLLNQSVLADWSAQDDLSGLALSNGTVSSGNPIDTSSVGAKTFTVVAEDKAGNKITSTVTYYVRYSFGSVLPPIKSEGKKEFKLGSTIPVKFQLKDAQGNNISTAAAKIYIAPVIGGSVGEKTPASPAGGTASDNQFRYDPTEAQYIFNLNTKSLSSGTWQIIIELDDGTSSCSNIEIK